MTVGTEGGRLSELEPSAVVGGRRRSAGMIRIPNSKERTNERTNEANEANEATKQRSNEANEANEATNEATNELTKLRAVSHMTERRTQNKGHRNRTKDTRTQGHRTKDTEQRTQTHRQTDSAASQTLHSFLSPIVGLSGGALSNF